MFRLSLSSLALLATAPLSAAAESDLPDAWSVDYARWAPGHAYGKAEARTDWPTLAWFEEPSVGHISEFPEKSGRHWLEIGFPAGKFGGGLSGHMFAANLAPRDAYTVEYDVHFPAGWEFSQNNTQSYGGGKLPGLSGGSHPAGGHGKPDGMSARPMWRRDSRFSPKPQNYLELYLYWRNQAEKYGDRFLVQQVEAGHTYRIKISVELGTPGADGRVRLWIDGTLRLAPSFRFLATGQDWKLTHYMHDVFYGGEGPGWAPVRDQHLLLGPVRIDTREF